MKYQVINRKPLIIGSVLLIFSGIISGLIGNIISLNTFLIIFWSLFTSIGIIILVLKKRFDKKYYINLPKKRTKVLTGLEKGQKLFLWSKLGIERTLKCVHFYDNQYKVQDGQEMSAVDKLLSRDSDEHDNCELLIDEFAVPIEKTNDVDYWMEQYSPIDFRLDGYSAYPPIPVEMLAPKEV